MEAAKEITVKSSGMFNSDNVLRKGISKKDMNELSNDFEYSEVVQLFQKFLERKSLRLQDLSYYPEKYVKLDGLLCEQIVKSGCHRSAFRMVFKKHGQIFSSIWGVK